MKRKNIRNFLKLYSEDLYREVIPKVFEIGVLNLQKSFARSMFTSQELRDIIGKNNYLNYY